MLKTFLRAALDMVLPPRCPGTGEVVDAPGMVSPAFWSELTFISAPHCTTCGLPFPHEMGLGEGEVLCAACLESPPEFRRARAAVTYNDASRKIIIDFKNDDRMQCLPALAGFLERAAAELMAECDVIVPVPLHPWRLWQRRFNQSALLARALAERTGKPCALDALLRRRHTPKQKGLSRKGRAANVRGAFAVREGWSPKGLKILLVDDVFTSGATINECAKALLRKGAEAVDVVTVARVTREEV